MGIGPLASLATNYISSLLSGSNNNTTTATTTPATTPQDSSLISPFAQILGNLQQLQQSNPSQYTQVTSQIATNLQTAASTATADGNTAQASQLTQLSKDFQSASSSGQLPNVSDLASAIGGHHHHHRHGGGGEASSASTATANSATDPTAIIENALSGSSTATASTGTLFSAI